jgi:Zn-dependent M16 (insulinase) family peptidase
MAEIVVNKGELKAIKDGIDKLLKLGKENVRHTQYATDEPRELTEREKKILTYVKNNPGTIKERVLAKGDIGSRMTIDKSINGLIEEKMLNS